MKLDSLGEIPIDTFLSEYWQKKPVLIRNAFENFTPPIDADELAGLACEEQVESRIVINNDEHWELKHGPFEENVFSSLPKSGWSLLVQAVDHWIPQASRFLEHFSFIPRWRVDDLMVSYATQGGGVGPHFDQYDVFLVQSSGQREWQIGELCEDYTELVKDAPVSILSNFVAKETWVLNPGDILYVPPGFAHNGIAVTDDCITCSVGFRAPSHSEVLREFTDHVGETLSESLRYKDADLDTQTHSGELSTRSLEKIQAILKNYAEDKQLISEWFGKYASTPKYPEAEEAVTETFTLSQLTEHLNSNGAIIKNESSRLSFIKSESNHDLFADGLKVDTQNGANSLIELLCNNYQVNADDFPHTDTNLNLVLALLNMGTLYLAE